MKLLVLDNYDSFTWNLVQLFGALGAEPCVRRNDALTVNEALSVGAGAIVISPGPCTPADAGISMDLVRGAAERRVPLLGVCLGHQALAAAFGATIERAPELMHGKTCEISHTGAGLFAGVPDPLAVMRYHSLVVRPDSVPSCLRVTAWTADKEIMGLRHAEHPIWGVQFHPESILTKPGKRMIANFLEM